MKLVRMAIRSFAIDKLAGYLEPFTTRREISRKIYCKALVDDIANSTSVVRHPAEKFGASRIVAETEPSRRGHSTCVRFDLTHSHASFFHLLHKPSSPISFLSYVLLSAITGMIWLTLIIQTIGIYVVSSPARHDLLNVLNTAVHAALVPSDYTPTSSHPFYTSKPTQHEPKLGSSLSFSGSRSLQLEEHEREILDEEIDDINEAPDSDIALPHPPVVQTDSQPYPFFVSSSGRFMLDFQCIWSYPVEGVDAALCRPNPESYRAHFSTAVRDYFCWASSTFWEAMRRSREGSSQGSVALIVIAWEVVVRRFSSSHKIPYNPSENVCCTGPHSLWWNLAHGCALCLCHSQCSIPLCPGHRLPVVLHQMFR